MATLHIDNITYNVPAGKNLLETCLGLGLDVPYFCWHPALGSVGACRQCAVKVFRDVNDKSGRLVMSCMEPVVDNQMISIDDPQAKEFREQVIEWLMTNHPHDCAVCDEGGSCHLQDMTVMTGHAYRRFRYKKRTYKNQYLGPFINHEMNRCIQCYRCVRFYKDYAGGKDLDVFASRNNVYFGRHEEGVLESEFSGNLTEVCPTGVFTDKTLKQHYTRKWDLTTAPSVCHHCGLGCNTIAGERYGSLRSITSRYHGEVNGYFLCDRGRFGYEFVNNTDRVRVPMQRKQPLGKDAIMKVVGSILKGRPVIGI
jgi:NADH-quinone oxidoreductase subunit G